MSASNACQGTVLTSHVFLLQIHKIMAGLLDMYTFQGNQLALEMVKNEAAFFTAYADDAIAEHGADHWLTMLEVEFGGKTIDFICTCSELHKTIDFICTCSELHKHLLDEVDKKGITVFYMLQEPSDYKHVIGVTAGYENADTPGSVCHRHAGSPLQPV